MPTIADVKLHITTACGELKSISGVTGVYLWGSYAQHIDNPNYVVKDVDIIACTNFDSGDLLAIDNSRYSALKMPQSDLEDMGFDPKAVAFTKRFLALEKYNVDHWAVSKDHQLLHWGAIPDNQNEWAELHAEAEQRAEEDTGMKRNQLVKAADSKRHEWKRSYDSYISRYLTTKSVGWFPSDHPVTDILSQAIKV